MNHPNDRSIFTQVDIFKDIVATLREPLVVLNANLRVMAANPSFYKFFKVKASETIGREIYDLGNRQWDIPELRQLLESILPEKTAFNDFKLEHDFPSIGNRTLLLNARRIPAPPKEAQRILLAFDDITERMQKESSLQASEERFRRVFETARDGLLLIHKASGQILNSNQSAEDLLGYSKRTLHKMHLWELGIVKDEQQFRQAASDLEEQGLVGLPDITIPNRQGRQIPVDIYLMDKTAVIQCNIRDISERKQAEALLQESEKKYRELFMEMENGAATHEIICDGEGHPIDYITLDVNKAYEAFLGVKKEDVVGKKASAFLPKAELQKWLDIFGPVALAGKPRYYELYSARNEKYFEGSAYCMAQGRFAVTFTDITERKKAEDELLITSKRLQEAQRIGKLGSMDWNLSTDEVHLSDGTRDILGLDQGKKIIMMAEVISLIHTAEKSRFRKKLEDALAGKAVFDLEFGILRRGHEEIEVHVTAELTRDTQGKPQRMLGIFQDITERKAAEDKIIQLNAELEKRIEERTAELRNAQEQLVRKEKLATLGQLAGSVSHELRNPLGVINNSVYYLKMIQPDADEKIKKHLALIEQEVHNSAQIISDLLDYAREIKTNPEVRSVPELAEHTLSRFPVPASIQVSFNFSPGLPPIYADPLHVEQILGNLITNACQAMPDGGQLTLSAGEVISVSAQGQKTPMVAIAVKDNGTGITSTDMKKLFEPLFSTKINGIGLGLAVSKKMAEANGGRIEVETEEGKGSTFTLSLAAHKDS